MKSHSMAAFGLVLLLAPWLATAEITASLDHSQAQLGDTLTLNLQTEGLSDLDSPDLAPLQRDFAILGTSTSSSVQIINGVRSAKTTLGVALQPLHTGHLVIPALHVGNEVTKPLAVDVSAASAGSSSGPASAAAGGAGSSLGHAIVLEGSVTPASAYVGQQVIYTLRMYFAVNIANGSLEDPQANGLDVHRIGSDADYQAVHAGRRYNVIERRYAITPEHAGTIQIPSLHFQGQVVDPNDPNAFFGAVTPAAAAAAPVSLQVLPIPADWGSSAWLPSSKVSLSLTGLSPSDHLKAGQPVTVTMQLQAAGVPSASLPNLSLPGIEGAQVYPDKASADDRGSKDGVVGQRQQSFAIVPSKAGALQLPEITIKWWNVATKQAEYARIPAQTLQVDAGAGAVPAAASSAAPASASSVAPVAAVATQTNPWQRVAYGLLLLWVATMLAGAVWWLARRRRKSKGPAPRVEPVLAAVRAPRRGSLQQAFLQAAAGTDSALQERTLLLWARSERASIRQLGELQAALQEGPQTLAIAALQRARYGGPQLAGEADLAAAFGSGLAWRSEQASSDGDDGLPPLYPFKLD